MNLYKNVNTPREMDMKERLTAHQVQPSHTLVDVRGPREFASERIPQSKNIPLGELEKSLESLRGQDDLVLVCASGVRARKAQEVLHQRGISACVLEGGVKEWGRCGLPLQREAVGGLSLERQVRIAAGTLAAIGGFLGAFVNPSWALLSAFVGCGLVFAGVTDTCGLAILLSKLPYNNRRGATCYGGSCSASSEPNSCQL